MCTVLCTHILALHKYAVRFQRPFTTFRIAAPEYPQRWTGRPQPGRPRLFRQREPPKSH